LARSVVVGGEGFIGLKLINFFELTLIFNLFLNFTIVSFHIE